MARPLRIEYSGAFYHIINRGLERREIFRHPKDYDYFLSLLKAIHEKYGVIVYAYCLMPNHYHLYLQTPQGNLKAAMRQLDGSHTQKFNKRYGRVGPLFQGRYKAVLVEADSYSLQLSKYIHLNPVKAKIAAKPEEYPYSSYAVYIGKTKPEDFLNTSFILSQFHKSTKKAIKALKSFTLQINGEPWKPEKETFKGLILGENDFVQQIQESYLQGKENNDIPQLKQFQKPLSLERLQKYILTLNYGSNHGSAFQKKLLAYALKKHSHMTLKQIGESLKIKSHAAVGMMVKRFEKEAEKNKHILQLTEKISSYCRKMLDVRT